MAGRLRSLALAAGLGLVASSAMAQGAYFTALEDVPMPQGFSETSGGWSFSGETGRIVEAHARGTASGLAVRDFYYETLPALGWAVSPQTDGSVVFVRGRERLAFTVRSEAGATLLGARLLTAPAPQD